MADWTPDMIATLRRLWREGWPTREIAGRLGVSRNGVIGKAWALRLGPHPDRAPKAEAGAPADDAPILIRTCQWPLGDPRSHDFAFCGARAETGRPYCREHLARAYKRLERAGEAA